MEANQQASLPNVQQESGVINTLSAQSPLPSGFEIEPSATAPGQELQGNAPPPGFQVEEAGKFETPNQLALTAAEGAASGFAGPVATWVEKKLTHAGVPGLNPQERAARAAVNPWVSGLSQAGGFGLGAMTGTGEAAVIGKVGEAAKEIAGLGKAVTVADKLKAAAAATAAEMGAFQVGDEASKYIDNAPQSIGSVAANVGMSTILGGLAGPAFGATGMAAKSVLDNTVLKDFVDRLAYRKANIDPNEMIKAEAGDAINTFYNMNNEITGAGGIKSQAIQKLLPEEMNEGISKQAAEILSKGQEAVDKLMEQKTPDRYVNKLQNDLKTFQDVVNNPESSVGARFDATNDFKKTLQDYSKGNWGPFAIPSHHEAYDFLNATKNLSREIRLGLEDPGVWGKAATLQKDLNKSWQKALPAASDFEKKFMTKVGDERVISSDKFNTYMNQTGKATSTTDRQKMLGNFIDAMDKHYSTVNDLYKAAGVENPFQNVRMASLKDSLNKKSMGAKLADMWHDKLGPEALGGSLGAAVGGHLGGLPGVYLGKEILGPAFTSLIRPMLERYPNVDINALHQALEYNKNVVKGQKLYLKTIKGLVEGGAKTFPSHLLPKEEELKKLDDRSKKLTNDLKAMSNVSGSLNTYQPEHGMVVSKTVGDITNLINSQRPESVRNMPLDTPTQPTAAAKTAFQRTLTICQQPLSVVKMIQDHTLTPKDVQTFQTAYPDYYQKMCMDIAQQVAGAVNDNVSIPYATKQSLSLFLGSPLDSTFTPASILAAQPIPKTPPAPQGAKMGKRGTSTLGKSNASYRTAGQAAEADRSSRDS